MSIIHSISITESTVVWLVGSGGVNIDFLVSPLFYSLALIDCRSQAISQSMYFSRVLWFLFSYVLRRRPSRNLIVVHETLSSKCLKLYKLRSCLSQYSKLKLILTKTLYYMIYSNYFEVSLHKKQFKYCIS